MKPTTAAQWIARQIVGNEVFGFDPLPASERAAIARALVDDPLLGWPDLKAAEATLDEHDWAETFSRGAEAA